MSSTQPATPLILRRARRIGAALAALSGAIAAGCAAERRPGPGAASPSSAISAAGPTPPTDTAKPAPSIVDRLASYLTGEFDSSAQAGRDAEYRTILLAICPVEAPELGPRVLYVEQAAATTPTQPYRQRLYVLEQTGAATVTSRVFEFTRPEAVVGSCAHATTRPQFRAADVTERDGCAVVLTLRDDQFVGSTQGLLCKSSLRGASYATSEVTLDAAGMRSWDRGFDAAGAQVWGATTGPYEFVRKAPLGGAR